MAAVRNNLVLNEHDIIISITSDLDVVVARHKGRGMAMEVGFSSSDTTLIATVISELARNIVSYAGRGEIILRATHNPNRRGVMVVARDEGPGITSVEHAMRDGYSTSAGLGMGLPGVRRLVDEFEIVSEVGRGTVVRVHKWKG